MICFLPGHTNGGKYLQILGKSFGRCMCFLCKMFMWSNHKLRLIIFFFFLIQFFGLFFGSVKQSTTEKADRTQHDTKNTTRNKNTTRRDTKKVETRHDVEISTRRKTWHDATRKHDTENKDDTTRPGKEYNRKTRHDKTRHDTRTPCVCWQELAGHAKRPERLHPTQKNKR